MKLWIDFLLFCSLIAVKYYLYRIYYVIPKIQFEFRCIAISLSISKSFAGIPRNPIKWRKFGLFNSLSKIKSQRKIMKLFLACIHLFCFIKFNEVIEIWNLNNWAFKLIETFTKSDLNFNLQAYPVIDWMSELTQQELPHPDIPFHELRNLDISLPIESQKLEKVRSVLKKGFEFYKAIDDIKDREEYRIIEAIDKIPLNCLLEAGSDEVRSFDESVKTTNTFINIFCAPFRLEIRRMVKSGQSLCQNTRGK